MVQLVTAQTGEPFSQDPAISLKNLLGASSSTTPPGLYGSTGASASLPVSSTVNVDTKWGPSGLHNRILITNLPRLVTHTTLGGGRIRTEDYKSVQVWCDTSGAINRKWLIEEEIRRIIEGNKLALQSVGIDEIYLFKGFGDIDVNEMGQEGDGVQRGGFLARSSCIVKMIYDEIVQ